MGIFRLTENRLSIVELQSSAILRCTYTASGKLAYSIENAQAARVKGIVVLSKSSADSGGENPYIVASASSDSVIRVWDVRKAADGKPLSEVHTKSRLTCLAGSSIRCESAFC